MITPGLDQPEAHRAGLRRTSSAPAAATTCRAPSPPTTSSTTSSPTRIAIVQDQTAFGKGLADEFKKRLNERGVREVMDEAINQGDKDFAALITRMKSAGVRLVYYGGYHTEAGLFVRQAREQGLDATLMLDSALVDQRVLGPHRRRPARAR